MILFDEKNIKIEAYDKELDDLLKELKKKNNYNFDYIVLGKNDKGVYRFELVESLTCLLDYFEDHNIVKIENKDIVLKTINEEEVRIFVIRRLDKRFDKANLEVLNSFLEKGKNNIFLKLFENVTIKLGGIVELTKC